jgi:hypothetical protein
MRYFLTVVAEAIWARAETADKHRVDGQDIDGDVAAVLRTLVLLGRLVFGASRDAARPGGAIPPGSRSS